MTLSRGVGVDGGSPDTFSKDGLAMSVMADSDIEGDPKQFLKVSEAYWQVSCVGIINSWPAFTILVRHLVLGLHGQESHAKGVLCRL